MNKGRQDNQWLPMDVGYVLGYHARINDVKRLNFEFIVRPRWVSNGNNYLISHKHLPASYTNAGNWEMLIDLNNIIGGPEEPYMITSIFRCIQEENQLDKAYVWVYTDGQMMNDPVYGQILYDFCLWHTFKLKLGHSVKISFVEMRSAGGKEIAEHLMKTAMIIPAHLVKPQSYAWILIFIHRLSQILKGWHSGGRVGQ